MHFDCLLIGTKGCGDECKRFNGNKVRGLRSQYGCYTSMLCVGHSVQLKRPHGSTQCFLFAEERKEDFKMQNRSQWFSWQRSCCTLSIGTYVFAFIVVVVACTEQVS